MKDTPLINATPEQLADAVEENLFALFRAMATLPGSEIVETETISRHLASPSNPMFKGAWQTRLTPGGLDAAIDETIAWFNARNAPFFFWWTGPGTEPKNIGEQLMAHGLISMEEQQQQLAPGLKSTESGAPGMVADLRQMNEAVLTQAPSGFTIDEVGDETALHEFKRVLIEGYELPDRMAHGWVEAALRAGIANMPWKMYVGRLNGEPVATNMLFNGGGVASVYAVATVPAARGKGIGGAITLKPLLEARDLGYRYAVLFSSDMGVHAYERIGFRLCDVRINRFLWRNT
ncbi:MAG: GNAT family N-acetyltransferase [Chloroflexi bacterium]|nr:GNAT family N-acetyltransferase [Chloroflexota bacterium]